MSSHSLILRLRKQETIIETTSANQMTDSSQSDGEVLVAAKFKLILLLQIYKFKFQSLQNFYYANFGNWSIFGANRAQDTLI